MPNPRSFFLRLYENTGLDWMPLILKGQKLPNSPLPRTMPQIREKFVHVTDDSVLDSALEQCNGLMKREEDRIDKIESKAFTLTGASGIVASFIVGFAGLLLDQTQAKSIHIIIIALLYIVVAVSLMMTMYLALKVVMISTFIYPSAEDVFNIVTISPQEVKRERIVSLFYSSECNMQLANRKGTYLIGAETWFRNSISLLLCLALFLGGYTLIKPPVSIGSIPQPMSTSIVQPTSVPIATLPPIVISVSPVGTPLSTVTP